MTASADGQLFERQGSGTWQFSERGAPAAGWRNAVAHRTVTAELRHLLGRRRQVLSGTAATGRLCLPSALNGA